MVRVATQGYYNETKLQHHGYESHQYSLYHGSKKFENNASNISI